MLQRALSGQPKPPPSPICLLFKRVENVAPSEGGADRAAPPRGKSIRVRHKYLRLIRSAAEAEFLQVDDGVDRTPRRTRLD